LLRVTEVGRSFRPLTFLSVTTIFVVPVASLTVFH